MLENEILIKLNTLDSNINYKMILIIAGIILLSFLAYQSGMFGNHAVVNATMNITNSTTGNFTAYGKETLRTVSNVSTINISALKGATI